MAYQLGFIGLGNMGRALIDGIVASHFIAPKQIIVFDPAIHQVSKLHQKAPVAVAQSEQEVAKKATIIILAVKPNVITRVLEKIKPELVPTTLIVSIAAGITLACIENIIGTDYKIIRVMPNTPALVNAGMSAIAVNDATSRAEYARIAAIFNQLGRVEEVPERLMHAVVGVSGSSPAFIFMLIEAMADGAVSAGMARDQAYKFAAQTVLGSAKMVLDLSQHPAELKDMVCSPSGTTIDAVRILEQHHFRSTVMEAVQTAADKSKQLSGE